MSRCVLPRDALTFASLVGKQGQKRQAQRPTAVGAPPPCPEQQWYTSRNPRDAYKRVLLPGGNPTPGLDRSRSVVGTTGHIERANAWTHLAGALLFLGYAFLRSAFIDAHSFASTLSQLSNIMNALVFAVSVTYHVVGTVPGWIATMRNLDHLAIYMAGAIAAAADIALVTNDFEGVPAHALVDPLAAATCIGVYFGARRWLVPSDETRAYQFDQACSLGLFRVYHSDLEHAGLRMAGIVVLALVWIPLTPAAFYTLDPGIATLYFVTRVLNFVLLSAGVVFDNAYLPDRGFVEEGLDVFRACACSSKRLGCVMNAHAWWHVFAVAAAIVLTASREYGVQSLSH